MKSKINYGIEFQKLFLVIEDIKNRLESGEISADEAQKQFEEVNKEYKSLKERAQEEQQNLAVKIVFSL